MHADCLADLYNTVSQTQLLSAVAIIQLNPILDLVLLAWIFKYENDSIAFGTGILYFI
jgi:hypothetical protein